MDATVIKTLSTVMLEPISCCNDVADKTLLPMKIASCVGTVRAIELLFVMRTTKAILGQLHFLEHITIPCGYISLFQILDYRSMRDL